jgi:hypothetical protein
MNIEGVIVFRRDSWRKAAEYTSILSIPVYILRWVRKR